MKTLNISQRVSCNPGCFTSSYLMRWIVHVVTCGLIIGRISILILLTLIRVSRVSAEGVVTYNVFCKSGGFDIRKHNLFVKSSYMLLDSAQIEIAIVGLRW